MPRTTDPQQTEATRIPRRAPCSAVARWAQCARRRGPLRGWSRRRYETRDRDRGRPCRGQVQVERAHRKVGLELYHDAVRVLGEPDLGFAILREDSLGLDDRL